MADRVAEILKQLEEGEITPAEAEARIAGREDGASKIVEGQKDQGRVSPGNGAESVTASEPSATKSFGFDWATRRENKFSFGDIGRRVTEVVQNVAGKPAKSVLCPSQQAALDGLLSAKEVGNILALWTKDGFGRSTILTELHERIGGKLLTARDFVEAMSIRHPLAMEEAFEGIVRKALESTNIVIVDDFHLLHNIVCCNHFYYRRGYLDAPLTSLAIYAETEGKKLILGCDQKIPDPIKRRGYSFGIDEFKKDDYEAICRFYLGNGKSGRIDFAKIYRFAPKLSAHQLKGACVWLRREGAIDTDRFIEYLRSQHMASNVDLGEVQAVELSDLKGVDDIIESLEANIILPLENDALASELNIKPKRGVLLAGPPGTGKTTIGRALAHRLKSKFFLIDGTIVSGTQNFYNQIHQIFEAAKQNAPCIIFIDDSDVIFESGEELGLYRYLLTILDGLESESAGRVCVMMTAMDVGNLPPALIRSGRIELWLETRLPDLEARESILRACLAPLPLAIGSVDARKLADATEGLTGADLKRLVEDGKVLYAYDRARNLPLREPTEYFISAVATVKSNRERYAEAEARAKLQKHKRPPWFDIAGSMMTTFVSDED